MQPATGNTKPQASAPAKDSDPAKTASQRPNHAETAGDPPKKAGSEAKATPPQKPKENAQIKEPDTVKAGKDSGSGAIKTQQSENQANLVPSLPQNGTLARQEEQMKDPEALEQQIMSEDQAQQLREQLYESFPEKKSEIKKVFEEFYALKFDLGQQVPSEESKVNQAKPGEASTAQEAELSPIKLHALPSFEQLVQRLKDKIGDAEFLEFFKKVRSSLDYQLESSSAILGHPNMNNLDPDSGKIEGMGGFSALRGAQLHQSGELSEQFRYSSLESNPEKEFENAKWVVLTTAQPCVDEEAVEKVRLEKQQSMPFDKLPASGTQVAHQNNLPSGLIAPQKRYAHSACMAGNKMYIFAGLAQKKGNLQTLYSATLYLDRLTPMSLYRWDKIKTDNPKARDSHTCIYMHDSLIMFGGSSVGKEYSFGDINKFDIKKKAWTKLEAMGDQPPPREAHIAHALGHDKMMIHGGINAQEETFNDTWVLIGLHAELDQMQSQIQRYINNEKYRQDNVRTSSRHTQNELEFLRWIKCTQSGQIPESRDSHTSCIINDNIYMFGGQGKGEGIFFNDLYQLKIHPMESDNHIPRYHACFTKIKMNSEGPMPPPRTSHSCVSYKNRYLVVIGGENEETPEKEGEDAGEGAGGDKSGDVVLNRQSSVGPEYDQQASTQKPAAEGEIKDQEAETPLNPENDKAGEEAEAAASGAQATTTMIKTDQPGSNQKTKDNQGNESVDSEGSNDEDGESKSQALGDVWVFDTHLKRWMEIKAPLFIQGSGAGKRIRKQFEPRMAHSAVIIDQFVVIFGGLNKETNSLISNDLYVLCLNGVTNALLPKEKAILPPPDDKKLLMKKPKLMKPLAARLDSQSHLGVVGAAPNDTKPRTESMASGRSLEDQPSMMSQQQEVGMTTPYLEQQERLELSGHIINSLINTKPGNKLNIAQMQREVNDAYLGRDADRRTNKVYREVEVQTLATDLASTKPQGLNEDCMGNRVTRSNEPEQTRLNHVLSIAGQIQSPIVALASFIDNSVQAFHSQVVEQLNQKRGPPLRLDISLVELPASHGVRKSEYQNRIGLQNLLVSNQQQQHEESKTVTSNKVLGASTGYQNGTQQIPSSANAAAVSTQKFIKITDNGPGISPYRMRQLLTQFGLQSLRPMQSGPFDIAEHGVGLKVATLRLGQTSLILSKTSPQNQIGAQYFSVALLSTEFVRKQHTPFLVAPLLCFTIRDRQSFHEMTEHGDEIFAEIRKHCGLAQFSTLEGLMDYALNEMDQKNGTHIFIGNLKDHQTGTGSSELIRQDGDIQINHILSAQRPQKPSDLALSQPWLIENSLTQFAKFMYLRHPQFLHLSINGVKVGQLANPFNTLMVKQSAILGDSKKDKQWFLQAKTDEFAMQLLSADFQSQIDDSQALEKSLMEQGISMDQVAHLLQGVLLYRGNRLVRRLQGRFNELQDQARLLSDLMADRSLMQNESGNEAAIDGEVRLGKRTFSQKNAESQLDFLLSHIFKRSGIVSIFPHASQTSIEKTDFQDKSVLSRIQDRIDSAEQMVQEINE